MSLGILISQASALWGRDSLKMTKWERIKLKIKAELVKLSKLDFQRQVLQEDSMKGERRIKASAELRAKGEKLQLGKEKLREMMRDLWEMERDGPNFDDAETDENGLLDLEEVRCTICHSNKVC
ncbi:unnamed protein product, partial [Chrysoparadoxa australica]